MVETDNDLIDRSSSGLWLLITTPGNAIHYEVSGIPHANEILVHYLYGKRFRLCDIEPYLFTHFPDVPRSFINLTEQPNKADKICVKAYLLNDEENYAYLKRKIK